MYQLWRFLKRGLVSDPQVLVGVGLLYITLGVSSRYASQFLSGINTLNESHSGSYEEEMRQYFIEQSLSFRKEVLRRRKEQV